MTITIRKHFTPTGIALIKNTVTSVVEDMDNLEPSCLASGNVKWCSPFQKPLGSSSRSVLAWRIPGSGQLGGLPSIGSHRVRHD